MPFGPDGVPSGSPEAWARQGFVPNTQRPPEFGGAFGGVQGQEMGMRLRQAMAANEITKPQMTRWTKEPWLAYPFLSQTIQTNDPMMAALGRWYLASRVGRSPEEQRSLAMRWEQTEPQAAAAIRQLVGSTQGGLKSALDIQLSTNEQLRKLHLPQDTNALEGFGSKFMDYMRDWREHPVTAAGVVLGFFVLYKAVKGRNIGTLLGLGALGIALYSFIRDQYGIQPTETLLAKPLETWGMPTAANIVRKTRDTLARPFVPSEEAGSALTYLGDKMNINSDDEKRMLGVVWQMKPADFLAAHQAVLNAKLGPPNQRVQLPPAVRQILRQMGADQTFARKWGNYSDGQRADIFLSVSTKILESMPGGMRFGAKHIQDRYVTGAWFNESFSRRGGRLAAARTVTPVEEELAGHFQYAVQHADMRMGDVLMSTVMTPQDWQNIKGYKGGLSANEIIDGVYGAGKRVVGWAGNVVENTWDIATNDVPEFFNYNVWPFLQRNGFNRATAIGIMDEAAIALRQARNSYMGVKDFVVGTTPFRVTKEGVLYVWDKGAAQWRKLWDNLDAWAREREFLRRNPPGPELPTARPGTLPARPGALPARPGAAMPGGAPGVPGGVPPMAPAGIPGGAPSGIPGGVPPMPPGTPGGGMVPGGGPMMPPGAPGGAGPMAPGGRPMLPPRPGGGMVPGGMPPPGPPMVPGM